MAELTCEVDVTISSVAKLTFVVAEVTFKVVVMTSSVVKINFVVAEITFKVMCSLLQETISVCV